MGFTRGLHVHSEQTSHQYGVCEGRPYMFQNHLQIYVYEKRVNSGELDFVWTVKITNSMSWKQQIFKLKNLTVYNIAVNGTCHSSKTANIFLIRSRTMILSRNKRGAIRGAITRQFFTFLLFSAALLIVITSSPAGRASTCNDDDRSSAEMAGKLQPLHQSHMNQY